MCEHSLELFVAWSAKQGLAHSTIRGYLAAIRFHSIEGGFGDPRHRADGQTGANTSGRETIPGGARQTAAGEEAHHCRHSAGTPAGMAEAGGLERRDAMSRRFAVFLWVFSLRRINSSGRGGVRRVSPSWRAGCDHEQLVGPPVAQGEIEGV